MLTKFSVKNFRNFNDWIHFDLTTDKRYEFNEQAVSGNVVQNAMVYGANGQGKSNLGVAICDIARHLNSRINNVVNVAENFLNGDSDDQIAQFKYQFVFNGKVVEYHYGKTAHDELVFEGFSIDGVQLVYWKRGSGEPAVINLAGAESLDKNISDNVLTVILYIKNNGNLVDNQDNQAFLSVIKFVEGMIYLRSINSAANYMGSKPEGAKGVHEAIINSGVEQFEAFLRRFNIKLHLTVQDNGRGKELMLKYKHLLIDFFNEVSSGTTELAILYGWLLQMKDNNVTFAYIDEFDAFYHHTLAKQIVREITQMSSQVILSTHNTSIMTNDLLRPDCYFEIYEGEIKPLYDLTGRELRKAHNLEKLYRAGAFDE